MVPKTTVAPGTEAFGFIFFVVRVLFFANASATKKTIPPGDRQDGTDQKLYLGTTSS